MLIVLNRAYGGYSVSKEFRRYWNNKYNTDLGVYDFDEHSMRTDPVFISELKNFGIEKASGPAAALEICKLPDDNVTDWIMNDYDGIETIYYVQNGKIFRL